MRCGYDLRGLPELVCPECRATTDAAWYRPPLAAGSSDRRALVLTGLFNAGLLAAALLAGVFVMTALPIRVGGWSAAPTTLIATLTGALVVDSGILLAALRFRRRLVWGPRWGAVLLNVILVAVFVLLVIAGELATRPVG